MNEINTMASKKNHRQMSGVVVSDKRDKTVAVKVSRRVIHKRYGKTITLSSKIHAHNEIAGVANGDWVIIEETRPISKTKAWKVVEILRKGESPVVEIREEKIN